MKEWVKNQTKVVYAHCQPFSIILKQTKYSNSRPIKCRIHTGVSYKKIIIKSSKRGGTENFIKREIKRSGDTVLLKS